MPSRLTARQRSLAMMERQVATPFALPAPTGGLNARDAFTDMAPDDAVLLDNVFPEASYCVVRDGFAQWSTGLGGVVESLMTWNGLDGIDKLFGARGSVIYDATAAGAATGVVTGLSNARWQYTNIENSGGAFLVTVNGADGVYTFDGTTWNTSAITGVNPAALVGVASFKKRLWFIENDSLTAWYLDAEAIAGAASPFPLGAVFRRGGYVQALGSFSNDSGEGPDDYLAFLSSNGEVAVYQGTDPDSATTWTLVGLFDMGRPIGRRPLARLNGDLGIITQDGVISMQAALRFDRASGQRAAITAKIQTLFGQYAASFSGLFGWQMTIYPKSRYCVVNIPQVAGEANAIQLVMNTVTGAWCSFSNMNAMCWAVANDTLYFGGNGIVYEAANGGRQDDGEAINWELATSWQAHAGAGNAYFTAVRPVMLTGGGVGFAIGVDTDFNSVTPTGQLVTVPAVGWTWPFTWPFTWGGTGALDARWQSVGAIGTWASVHVVGQVNGASCRINSFDLLAQKGGVY